MKLLLIFAAVLLSTVTAKVTPTSVDQVNTVSNNPKPVVDVVPGGVVTQVVPVTPIQHAAAERMDKSTKMAGEDVVTTSSIVGVINKDTEMQKMSGVVPPLGSVVVPPIGPPVVAPIGSVDMKMVEPTVMPVVGVQMPPVKVPLIKDPMLVRKTRAVAMMPEMSKTVSQMPVVEMPKMSEMDVSKVPIVPAMIMPVMKPVAAVSMPMITKAPSMMRRRRAMEMPVIVPVPGLTQMKKDPLNCDMQCTKFDLNPICASNGECLHEFPNQCIMDTFNCVHPELGFKATKDQRCEMHWLKRCTEQDLMT